MANPSPTAGRSRGPAPAELPEWLQAQTLLSMWERIGERLERRSLRPEGRISVTVLDRAERHAVAALLGHPVVAERVQIDLAELDCSLRERTSLPGLLAVVELALGRTLHDRSVDREHRRAQRERPYAAVQAAILAHGALGWEERWLTGIRASGVLARLGARDDALVVVLTGVHALRQGPISRSELAARIAGDAHALDDQTVLGQLTLRALAAQHGIEMPSSTRGRRELWTSAGVLLDTVSTTCLTLGLDASPGSSLGARLALARESGDPVHLSEWDLRRGGPLHTPRAAVLVCENPRVLEAVAETHAGRFPVVCANGSPTLLTMRVLSALRSRSQLLYHGDFDWPGLAIATRVCNETGARPWLMSSSDYSGAAASGPPLTGSPMPTPWDPELSVAMSRTGVAVHEEAVLGGLLSGLEAALGV